MVDRLALRLLRREVLRRAHDRPGLRHLGGASARDPEVRDLEAVVDGHDHVVGLEVAMDHAALVREAGGVQDLDPEVDRPLLAERRLLRDVVAGAGIGILSSYIFTKPYKGWNASLEGDTKSFALRLNRRF